MTAELDSFPSIEPGRVPKWFIRELQGLGVGLKDRGLQMCAVEHIRSESLEYKILLDMLTRLKDTKVVVMLGYKRDEPVYDPPCPIPKSYFMIELHNELPKLVTNDPFSQSGVARGEARWLVDAVVRMMIDPPECCVKARNIPIGHYILSVQMHFANLICHVSVYKNTNAPPTVTEPLGDCLSLSSRSCTSAS